MVKWQRMSKIDVQQLDFYYGEAKALDQISMRIAEHEITALIGPSGCGKSTFLRCLNRMNDTIPGTRAVGQITLDGADIYAPDFDVTELRRRVGLVFQKPNPFPQSILDNVAFGPRVLGRTQNLNEIVEQSLRGAALWDEVKNHLRDSALSLSLGQQQRLHRYARRNLQQHGLYQVRNAPDLHSRYRGDVLHGNWNGSLLARGHEVRPRGRAHVRCH